MDSVGLFGQLLVLPVYFGVFRPRDGVIRISFGLGKLVNNAGLRMFLAGEVFELGDTSKSVIVWIIHHCHWLENRLMKRFVLKFQATVRKLAELKVEKFIDRPGVDKLP